MQNLPETQRNGVRETPESTNNEIVFYQMDNLQKIEVKIVNETVWLNRQQLSILFGRDVKTIGKHINNALKEELKDIPAIANFATIQLEGQRFVNRNIDYYNLDMILSIGYRVKSDKGILFRRWANEILKNVLYKGFAFADRIEKLEGRVAKTEKQIGDFLQTALPPKQGIFFNGQIFDAYQFAIDLITSVKHSIILIDNYIDGSTLLMLSKRKEGVNATIYTKNISPALQQDISKFNAQYPPITVKTLSDSHDRFLILDEKELYLIGASLKDLGKKWFAFSKIEDSAVIGSILAHLPNLQP